MRLLNLGSGDLYHIGPFFDVLTQIGVELIRGFHQRNRTLLEPDFLHFGQIDDLVDGRIKESDDFLGSALWRHNAKPDCRLVAGNRFGNRQPFNQRKAGL